MNWRKLVLHYAADVLHQIGEDELSREVRAVDVPIIDGGGIHFGAPCSRGYHVDSEFRQSVDKDEQRHVFLLLR